MHQNAAIFNSSDFLTVHLPPIKIHDEALHSRMPKMFATNSLRCPPPLQWTQSGFFLVLRYFSVSVFTLDYLFYTSASYAATQALCLCLVRPTFCAVGISFALHEYTERLSMKFAAGNHYHQQINRLACLTYKLLTTGQPAAAAHARLLHHYTSTRTLRSTNQFFLDVPRFSTEFGKRSFTWLLQSEMDNLLTSDFHPLLTPSNTVWKLTFQIAHQHPYHAAHLVTASASDSVSLLNFCEL